MDCDCDCDCDCDGDCEEWTVTVTATATATVQALLADYGFLRGERAGAAHAALNRRLRTVGRGRMGLLGGRMGWLGGLLYPLPAVLPVRASLRKANTLSCASFSERRRH